MLNTENGLLSARVLLYWYSAFVTVYLMLEVLRPSAYGPLKLGEISGSFSGDH
jgi:hypothetical protein